MTLLFHEAFREEGHIKSSSQFWTSNCDPGLDPFFGIVAIIVPIIVPIIVLIIVLIIVPTSTNHSTSMSPTLHNRQVESTSSTSGIVQPWISKDSGCPRHVMPLVTSAPAVWPHQDHPNIFNYLQQVSKQRAGAQSPRTAGIVVLDYPWIFHFEFHPHCTNMRSTKGL